MPGVSHVTLRDSVKSGQRASEFYHAGAHKQHVTCDLTINQVFTKPRTHHLDVLVHDGEKSVCEISVVYMIYETLVLMFIIKTRIRLKTQNEHKGTKIYSQWFQ